jgi:transposase
LDAHQGLYVLSILDSNGKLIKGERLKGAAEVLFKYLRKVPQPFQICYEASCTYGYLYDQLQQIARRVVVAHPGGLRLIFRAKRKNDRIDAHKLAKLLFLDEVPVVHVPGVEVRDWRQLIQFRRRLVTKRTQVKNQVRALLRTHGIAAPRRQGLWTRQGRTWLAELEWPTRIAGRLCDAAFDELEHLEARLRPLDRELDSIARRHPQVRLLQTIPGVGPRTAEALVAWIDDVHRFRSSRQVGCYFGLVPCQDQSHPRNRLGHITGDGPAVVRQLLCEAAWQAKRRSPFLRAYFERIQQGDADRTKIAIVALSRYLACVAAAMLRNGEVWRHDRPTEDPPPVGSGPAATAETQVLVGGVAPAAAPTVAA